MRFVILLLRILPFIQISEVPDLWFGSCAQLMPQDEAQHCQ